MKISFAHAVCVNINVHAGYPVFLIDFLKASKEFGSVIFFEAIGT